MDPQRLQHYSEMEGLYQIYGQNYAGVERMNLQVGALIV
jgi:hypothetical protein